MEKNTQQYYNLILIINKICILNMGKKEFLSKYNFTLNILCLSWLVSNRHLPPPLSLQFVDGNSLTLKNGEHFAHLTLLDQYQQLLQHQEKPNFHAQTPLMKPRLQLGYQIGYLTALIFSFWFEVHFLILCGI